MALQKPCERDRPFCLDFKRASAHDASLMRSIHAVLFLAAAAAFAAEPAFDPASAKDKLRALHQQFTGAQAAQRASIAQQMIQLTGPLVKAEPDGVGGWLLHAEAALALKQDASCKEAAAQLQRLHAAASGNPLASSLLPRLRAAAAASPQPAAGAAGSSFKSRLQEQPN